MGRHKAKIKSHCPDRDKHTTRPDGYLYWYDWAEIMNKTHNQVQCESCGLFSIWVEK